MAEDRIASLDAFRGFAVAAMILVNNPGDWDHIYRPLDHAPWHGWTFTDAIFPFFLFACGVAMPITIARRRALGVPDDALLRRFVARAAILFAIGLALNFMPAFDLSTLRIPGVLQRIALSILIAAPFVVWSGPTGRSIVIAVAALLIAYAGLMLLVPVPGFDGVVAAGRLEPGRDAGSFVDRLVLGGHLWSKSKTWDPEGLASTLPAACTLLLGALAACWLLDSQTRSRALRAMIAFACVSLAGGWLLDAFLMPVNKNLWTPSYVLLMNGWALLLLAALYWAMDASPRARLRAHARGSLRPLTMFGRNALFLFVLSGLVARLLGAVRIAGPDGAAVSLKARLYAPIAALPLEQETASLCFAVVFDVAMFAVAWWMWRKRWFVTA